jgi:hypothetical protein
MFQGQVDVISNQATWQSKVYELVDEEDGTTTDLSDAALTVDIVVTIRAIDDPASTTALATASIDNGQGHGPRSRLSMAVRGGRPLQPVRRHLHSRRENHHR